jgi:regulator of chromosome condensation
MEADRIEVEKKKKPVNKRKLENEDVIPRHQKKARVVVEEEHEIVENADILFFGSGEQGNQLPRELVGKVNFRRKPAVVTQFNSSNIRQVAACGYQTAILLENRDLYTFGCNDDGALGRPIDKTNVDDDDRLIEESTPTQVQGVQNLSSVAMGSFHTAALTTDGKLYSWGGYKEESGFLDERKFAPSKVPFFENSNIIIKQVVSSFNVTVALTTTGKCLEWGATLQRNPRRSCRPCAVDKERLSQMKPTTLTLSGVEHIFAGGDAHFAIDRHSNVYAWGINGFGQLGTGDNHSHERPRKVKDFPEDIVDIACGANHTLLLTKGGEVYSFGRNAYGQLGHGEDEPVPEKGKERAIVTSPKKIEFFSNLPGGEKATKIACGDHHSAVVTSQGNLYTFGFAEQYRLGNCSVAGDEENDEITPYKVGGAQLETRLAVNVACGTDHTIFIAKAKPV